MNERHKEKTELIIVIQVVTGISYFDLILTSSRKYIYNNAWGRSSNANFTKYA